MSDTKRDIIRWTDEEQTKIVAIVAGTRIKDPNATLTDLVNRAQEQLPASRRREIRGLNHFKPLVPKIESALLDLAKRAALCDEYEKRVHELEARKQKLTEAEAIAKYREIILSELTPDDVISLFPKEVILGNLETSELIGYTTQRAYADWQEATSNKVPERIQVERAYTAQVRPYEPPVHTITTKKPRLPRVVVMGPKPSQQNEIMKQCESFADLWFSMNSDIKPERADIVVIWTRFVSHRYQTHCKSLVPPRYFAYHSGGLNGLISIVRDKCEEWLTETA